LDTIAPEIPSGSLPPVMYQAVAQLYRSCLGSYLVSRESEGKGFALSRTDRDSSKCPGHNLPYAPASHAYGHRTRRQPHRPESFADTFPNVREGRWRFHPLLDERDVRQLDLP
jgi:hypothetical protein